MSTRIIENVITDVKFPTNLKIDILGPCGNVHYIIGVCKRMAHQLQLSESQITQFIEETKLDGSKTYDEILDTCQEWFGLIYINRK